MIFFTADPHFDHKNIIKYCDRPYNSIEDMNQCFIDNINKKVGVKDTLWILGDWGFSKDPYRIKFLRSQINCVTVNIIIGNHDKWSDLCKSKAFNVVDLYREINIGKQQIVLFHYPLASWYKHNYGTWMLHGHCHNKLSNESFFKKRKILDVGVDNPLCGYAPLSYDEIKVIMKK